MKLCRICGKKKWEKSFNKNAATKDGLQTKCRDCERIYRIKNKKHIVKRRAKYNAMKREEKLRDGLSCEELNKSVYGSGESTETDSNFR